jgi:hypothetical protein
LQYRFDATGTGRAGHAAYWEATFCYIFIIKSHFSAYGLIAFID